MLTAAAVLALIPLARSQLFGPMAMMGGIAIATVLTLVVLRELHAAWFRARAAAAALPAPAAA